MKKLVEMEPRELRIERSRLRQTYKRREERVAVLRREMQAINDGICRCGEELNRRGLKP